MDETAIAHPSRFFASLGLVAAAAALLLLPVLWNGYPFIYYDSGDYLQTGLSGLLTVYRDPVYGLAIAPLHAGLSVWPIAIVQSLLAAWLLLENCRLFLPRPGRGSAFLLLTAILSLGSSLPWFTGMVMPDIFGGLAVLSLPVMAFGHLSLGKRLALALLLAVGLASHLSFLPTGFALLLLLLALRPWLVRQGTRPRLAGIALAILTAPLLVGAANSALGGPFALSQTGHMFILGRMMQDGLAKATLDRLCPDEALSLCAERDHLPSSANDFLWGESTAFDAIGGWLDSKEQAQRIIAASLRLLPGGHLESILRTGWEQFGRFDTADGLEPQTKPWGVIGQKLQGDLPAYLSSRQQTERLEPAAINRLHRPLGLAALTALPCLLLLSWRRRLAAETAALALLLGALVSNAFVCAALSNPVDRYQSRLVWLALFALGTALARALAFRLARPVTAAVPRFAREQAE